MPTLFYIYIYIYIKDRKINKNNNVKYIIKSPFENFRVRVLTKSICSFSIIHFSRLDSRVPILSKGMRSIHIIHYLCSNYKAGPEFYTLFYFPSE